MLDSHIIYYGEIKDIGEWHHIGGGLLQSLGRAAGRAMAFDSGVRGRRGGVTLPYIIKEKRARKQ